MQINERNRKIILVAVWAVLIALDAAGLIWCIVRLNTGTLSQGNFSYSLLHFFVSFASISGILLAEWVLRFRAGMPLVICCMLFGFFGNTVSNVWRMYDFFPAWDMVLHSLSGVLFAAVGLGLGSLVTYNQPEGKLKVVAVVAFSFFFSLSVGFLWEVFEFTVDTINPASSTQGWADGILESYPDGTYLVSSRRGTAILDTMEDMILHLGPAEQRTVINALVEQRERQEQAMSQTEQLLRRMTGSITAYMDEVGRRPLRLSDYDQAVLAIRDGELDTFRVAFTKVPDRADDLLIEAAGRPGRTGGDMVQTLLSAVERFSPEAYLTACKRAVETGDSWRVHTLVSEAKTHLAEPSQSLAGEVMLHAYANDRKSIAADLIDQCSPEQIAAAPPILLRQAAVCLDFQTAVKLVDKGIQPGNCAADVLHTLTAQHQDWMAERLLEHGMPVAPDNYAALHACLNNGAAGIGKLLLDGGIDLERYQAWAEHRPKSEEYRAAIGELAEYWAQTQTGPQQDGPSMGDMSL